MIAVTVLRFFFVSCSLFEVVNRLLSLGLIKGEGCWLRIDHRDQTHGGTPHGLKFKVAAGLLDLLLVCRNLEFMATILPSFDVPLRASKASMSWEDLTSFDVTFLCEEIDTLPQSIEVTIGLNKFDIKLRVNYTSQYAPPTDRSPSSQDSDEAAMDEDELEFWFKSAEQGNANHSLSNTPTTPTVGLLERSFSQRQATPNLPSPMSATRDDFWNVTRSTVAYNHD